MGMEVAVIDEQSSLERYRARMKWVSTQWPIRQQRDVRHIAVGAKRVLAEMMASLNEDMRADPDLDPAEWITAWSKERFYGEFDRDRSLAQRYPMVAAVVSRHLGVTAGMTGPLSEAGLRRYALADSLLAAAKSHYPDPRPILSPSGAEMYERYVRGLREEASVLPDTRLVLTKAEAESLGLSPDQYVTPKVLPRGWKP